VDSTEALLDLGRANRQKPGLEVADIFRAAGPAYRQSHALSPEQLQVMAAIEACRTAALGGHVELCPDCGKHRQISYIASRCLFPLNALE